MPKELAPADFANEASDAFNRSETDLPDKSNFELNWFLNDNKSLPLTEDSESFTTFAEFKASADIFFKLAAVSTIV